MGCSNTKTSISIIHYNYYPVNNPYLVHCSLTGVPLLNTYNFNSNTYSEKFLNITRLYSGSNIC